MADENNEVSLLEMSDEDLLNFDPSTLSGSSPVEEPSEQEPEVQEEQEEVPVEEEPEQEEEREPEVEPTVEAEPEGQPAEQEPKAAEVAEPEAEKPAEPAPAEGPDYKAAYEKIFAPFRANGKDMRIDSVDDAIALMQMGANYNKKMASLKPNLKLLKLLENNNLLTEEKIGFLIDLEKKDPTAISKLIKDSGIDPLEVDLDKAGEYRPQHRTVDDREIELDAVLDDIKDTPTYKDLIHVVSNQWDGQSKQAVANSPQLLKVINNHMALGIYDRISSEIERERMFGRLNGLSDLEAYRKVGDAIEARGGFADLAPTKPVAQGQVPVPAPVTKPQPKAEDPKLKDKKRAASPSVATAPSKPAQDFNPLALSDEEFSKLVNPKLM